MDGQSIVHPEVYLRKSSQGQGQGQGTIYKNKYQINELKNFKG